MFHLINKENRGAILSSTKRYSPLTYWIAS
jgi:hypothetical protein